ncbi:hypothetical protein LLG96_02065 [bacterium]|nr:hypothetical protein [bacterium]
MLDRNEQDIRDRIRNLERRIEELSARFEKQLEQFLDADMKARGLK